MEWVGLVCCNVLHTAPPSHPPTPRLPLLQIIHFMDINKIYRGTTFTGDSQTVTNFGLQIKRVRSMHASYHTPTHHPPMHRQLHCPLQLIIHVNASQEEGHYNRAEPFSSDQLLTVSRPCCSGAWARVSSTHYTHTLLSISPLRHLP